jgi:diguanylate cyclase (GGDEF)-like protein
LVEHRCTVLLVDDEPYVLDSLAPLLARDFDVLTASSAAAAQKLFAQRDIHLLLADQKMPGMTGVELLEWARTHHPKTIRLMLTGYSDFEQTVGAINRGQIFRIILKPWRTDELLLILHSAARSYQLERSVEEQNRELHALNQELEQRVAGRTRELQEAVAQLQHKTSVLEVFALTDQLTGLPNRRAMDGLIKFELRRRLRYPCPLSLGLIDLDQLKEINTRWLLPGGDQVLVHVGRVLAEAGRASDTIGRIGGDEFMIIAPETPLSGANTLADRLRSMVADYPASYESQTIPATVSIGFAVASEATNATYDQLKYVAAAALNEAKGKGRNCAIVRAIE